MDEQIAERVMGIDTSIAPEHNWLRNSDGEIDMMGMDADRHNGPACQRCGYGFCIHCEGDAGYTAEPCQRPIMNYSGSIIFAQQVENEIERRGLAKFYIEALAASLGITRETLIDAGASALWCILRATPEQRCHAALLAARAALGAGT